MLTQHDVPLQLLDVLVPLFHPEEDEPPPVGIAKVLDGGDVSEGSFIWQLHEAVSAGCVLNRIDAIIICSTLLPLPNKTTKSHQAGECDIKMTWIQTYVHHEFMLSKFSMLHAACSPTMFLPPNEVL